jgi:hypothetical protein
LLTVLLIPSITAALSAPHYTWTGAWETRWTVDGAGYSAVTTGPGAAVVIRSTEGEPLAELPGDTLLLGDIEGRLYVANLGRRYVLDSDGRESESLFLALTAGTPTAYSLGIQDPLSIIELDAVPGQAALSPDGRLLALAHSSHDDPSAEVIVYETTSGGELNRRTFTADTTEQRAAVECLAFDAAGETLFLNLHPHSPASDEFLDPQPLLAWDRIGDAVEELTGPLGWVLPVAGREGGEAILLQEYTADGGRPTPHRWLELEPESGELAAAFHPRVNQGLGDPAGPARLLDGDGSTVWTFTADTVVDLELGRELYILAVAVLDDDGPAAGWGLRIGDETRLRRPDDPEFLTYDGLTEEIRLIFPAGSGGAEIQLQPALLPRP